MRIIAGDFGGRKLLSPRTLRVRPSSDRFRESLFNILQGQLENKTFLDLFAGVGTVGLEALSRGALRCVFVDHSSQSLEFLKKNTAFCRDRVTILPVSVEAALRLLEKKGDCFDFIFLDPPFAQGWVQKTLEKLDSSSLVPSGGSIMVQHDKTEEVSDTWKRFKIADQRTYGQSLLTILR